MTTQISSLRAADLPTPALASRQEPFAGPAARPNAEPVLPNPQLRLDAALGLVVIEFRDRGGEARTIPTERELDAYRLNGGAAPSVEPGDPIVGARVAGEAAGPTGEAVGGQPVDSPR